MSEEAVMGQRTEGPWRIWDCLSEYGKDQYPEPHKGDVRLVGAKNICIGIIFGGYPTMPELDANAVFICLAVNSHAELLARQEELVQALEETEREYYERAASIHCTTGTVLGYFNHGLYTHKLRVAALARAAQPLPHGGE